MHRPGSRFSPPGFFGEVCLRISTVSLFWWAIHRSYSQHSKVDIEYHLTLATVIRFFGGTGWDDPTRGILICSKLPPEAPVRVAACACIIAMSLWSFRRARRRALSSIGFGFFPPRCSGRSDFWLCQCCVSAKIVPAPKSRLLKFCGSFGSCTGTCTRESSSLNTSLSKGKRLRECSIIGTGDNDGG